jgi:excisionase family DNA binding protein
MNEFGQKGKVPLSERLSVSPEEASALTGIGLTSIREAISSGDLKAKKHGRRTIILPDDLRVWLKTLPDARKPIVESPASAGLLLFGGAAEPTDGWEKR